MAEVYLTAKQAAEALGLSYFTVVKYAGQKGAGPFPHAILRTAKAQQGYKIPATDILNYARTQGEDVEQRAMREITKARAAQAAEDGPVLQAVGS